jgi:hypothetical protein
MSPLTRSLFSGSRMKYWPKKGTTVGFRLSPDRDAKTVGLEARADDDVVELLSVDRGADNERSRCRPGLPLPG